jgi:hypothetical protein
MQTVLGVLRGQLGIAPVLVLKLSTSLAPQFCCQDSHSIVSDTLSLIQTNRLQNDY